jgi:hypothetical protein
MKDRFSISTALLAISLALGGCGDEGSVGPGDGASVTLTAPGVSGPNSSAPTSDTQPTLTVTNATASSGGSPTYSFQVASDQGFGSIVVQTSGVAQGSGQTSWEVSQPLADGSYFWRARADVSGVAGPFSAVAQVAILGVGGGPGESIVVSDNLLNGSTVATARQGGAFTSSGWRVDTNDDFLRYEVPSIANGYVQWENVGLTPQGIADSRMFFGMWDPTAGNYRTNAFRVNLQHAWPPDHNPPWIRLRWISQGHQEDGGYNFNTFDPGRVYTWRIEWGPEGEDELARVSLDGVEVIRLPYLHSYQPNVHWIELGIEDRHESIIGLVYRNFAVVRRP